jgi:hypothetical protein
VISASRGEAGCQNHPHRSLAKLASTVFYRRQLLAVIDNPTGVAAARRSGGNPLIPATSPHRTASLVHREVRNRIQNRRKQGKLQRAQPAQKSTARLSSAIFGVLLGQLRKELWLGLQPICQ